MDCTDLLIGRWRINGSGPFPHNPMACRWPSQSESPKCRCDRRPPKSSAAGHDGAARATALNILILCQASQGCHYTTGSHTHGLLPSRTAFTNMGEWKVERESGCERRLWTIEIASAAPNGPVIVIIISFDNRRLEPSRPASRPADQPTGARQLKPSMVSPAHPSKKWADGRRPSRLRHFPFGSLCQSLCVP